ncbi:MAG: DHH family phosphoesterase [Alistipes sp.]|nr:DHH family phosphoesterase [Alistipes sp.]
MKLSVEHVERLRELLARPGQRIVTVAHTNPDGDAVGSSLAWAEVLRAQGHEVVCIVPNKYPYFLDWMPGIDEVVIFRNDTEGRALKAVAEADLIFCLDFNSLSRLEILSDTIAANTTARRVLIDHHLAPDKGFDAMFSYPQSSSTCYLVYRLIKALYGTEAISLRMAEALYVGMMTDTGNFAFSSLTPELFRAVAVLVERGIHIPTIYNNVYNAYTEGRARLFGYAINRKMQVIEDGTVAYMSLMEHEMRRFQFQQGDSEGFVNYPLTIKKMKMSAMFLAHRKFIRISLRSRGDVDVNLFARKYFNGGGHKNAAGGKSFVSMEETIEHFVRSVREFAEEGHLEGSKTKAPEPTPELQ